MPISQVQAEQWQQYGWVIFQAMFSEAEINLITREFDFLTSSSNAAGQSLHYFEVTHSGPAICRTERFLEDSQVLSDLVLSDTLREPAAALLGEQAVLYKEKINYKQPGGAGFAPHQDATAYEFINHHITCLVCIDNMTEENGGMQLAPGHRYGIMPTNDKGCIDSEFAKSLEWQTLDLKAGDALFFDSFTPHRSGTNHSNSPRRAIYLTFNAAQEGDKRLEYYENRERRMANSEQGRISTIGHFEGQSSLVRNG